MKASLLTLGLVAINGLLALALGWTRTVDSPSQASSSPRVASSAPTRAINPATAQKTKRLPETPFAAIYSVDAKQFVANLRAIGCPEETVKDILTAEINRRYAPQENALRPK